MTLPPSLFFGRERGMAFFLGFLAFIIVVLPMVGLSPPLQLALSLVFSLTLIFGAFAIIQHRVIVWLIVVLAVSNFAADLTDFIPAHRPVSLETTLRLVCLAILVCMTLKKILSPG